MNQKYWRLWRLTFALITIIFLAACESQAVEDENSVPTAAATAVAAAPTEAIEEEETEAVETAEVVVPSTWTPAPTEPAPATSTPLPTVSPAPTDTPQPIPTNTPLPTNTPIPTATPVLPTNTPAPTSPPAPPTPNPNPVLGVNVLPNPSFEEGWYNQNGIPELQLPNRWNLDWDTGPTGFGSEAWDVYVRPETRVLPASMLPPAERPDFIYDGTHTVKIFKGSGAISFRLWTEVTLEPGTYRFEIRVFPDQVVGYENGQKVWAQDPRSGEVRIWAGDRSTDWLLLNFGTPNTRYFDFTIDQAQTMRVGIWGRGRYAIANDGFFFDDFSLKRIEG